LTPVQEFREYRDWFTHHKRDPFLWLIILLPLTFAKIAIGVPAILISAFPYSDAVKSLQPILQRPDVGSFGYKTICKLPQGTYIFGYDVAVKADKADQGPKPVGRVCRDVVKGGWVFAAKQDDGRFIPDGH
jgi:hypothetical protein